MERVDKTNKSFQFFLGEGCGPKTIVYVAATAGRNDRATEVVRFVAKCRCFRNTWKLTYTLGNSKNERTETNFQTTGPWLPTESMNDFHSLNRPRRGRGGVGINKLC